MSNHLGSSAALTLSPGSRLGHYDPTNRDAAYAHIRDHQKKGEVVTGLLC